MGDENGAILRYNGKSEKGYSERDKLIKIKTDPTCQAAGWGFNLRRISGVSYFFILKSLIDIRYSFHFVVNLKKIFNN